VDSLILVSWVIKITRSPHQKPQVNSGKLYLNIHQASTTARFPQQSKNFNQSQKQPSGNSRNYRKPTKCISFMLVRVSTQIMSIDWYVKNLLQILLRSYYCGLSVGNFLLDSLVWINLLIVVKLQICLPSNLLWKIDMYRDRGMFALLMGYNTHRVVRFRKLF
jgi:hypothetical protein